jgi:hypothetical protein
MTYQPGTLLLAHIDHRVIRLRERRSYSPISSQTLTPSLRTRGYDVHIKLSFLRCCPGLYEGLDEADDEDENAKLPYAKLDVELALAPADVPDDPSLFFRAGIAIALLLDAGLEFDDVAIAISV